MTFVEQTITELGNGDYSQPNPRLLNLSNLSAAQQKLFGQSWQSIAVTRKRQIMEQLVDLVEDNVELNFDSIFRYCLNDSDATVRTKAIEGLWECEDTSLIAPLTNIFEHDCSLEAQTAAGNLLRNYALLSELGKIRERYGVIISTSLLRVFNDHSRSVELRSHALEAMSPLSLPEVREAIRQAYHSDVHELKASALYAMGRNCDTNWLPILIKEMENTDADLRCEAAAAGGEIGEPQAVPYLSQLVDDIDTAVALAAIQALGKIGGPEAKKQLKQLLSEPEVTIKQAAEAALAELQAEEAPFSFGITDGDNREKD